jgi:cyanophycinase
VDFDTYSATGQFTGANNTLSLRTVTTHLVPPGAFGFDLTQLQPIVNGSAVHAPSVAGRNFSGLHVPAGYGPLILAGDISGDRSGLVSQRFVALSGGSSNARIVVLTLGYAKSSQAQSEAKAISAALQSQVTNPVQWFVIDSKTNQADVQNAIANATGIFVSAPNQASVLTAFNNAGGIASAIQNAWAGGKVLLADNAAAAALGSAASTDATPTSASLEDDAMGDFLYSGVSIQPGLNWLSGIAVEPRFVMDRHWGRAYNHLYRNSSLIILGIDVNTAVEFSATNAAAIGQNTVTIFDGRYGSYGLGTNDAISARYVILDNYVNGETVTP